jgi:hypothetical protein
VVATDPADAAVGPRAATERQVRLPVIRGLEVRADVGGVGQAEATRTPAWPARRVRSASQLDLLPDRLAARHL